MHNLYRNRLKHIQRKCFCKYRQILTDVSNSKRDKMRETYVPYVGVDNRTEFAFDASKLTERDVFSLVMPPPNITGTLHLGHALTATLQDVVCRWKRASGHVVCWVPGADHAGIATQVVVEKYLSARNMNRLDLGYDVFQTELRGWTQRNRARIRDQLTALDLSLDWTREVFTMDEKRNRTVTEAFLRLHGDGLIYRDNRLVNWSCALKSSVSDIEVDDVQIDGPTNFSIPGYDEPVRLGEMVEIFYKVSGNPLQNVPVATTRPETILGDTAVAVHPSDQRYSHLIGCRLRHPFLNKTIPLIADESVDINFGTGAVKITPAHDRNDYEISKRHSLESISVINDRGLIENNFGQFSGMKIYEARKLIIDRLTEMGLLKSIKPHKMAVPVCSRNGDIIELLLCPQWYLDCKKMSIDALECIKNGSLKLIPEDYENVWCDWFEKQQDWCISRQLWWGHRIPAYKCYRPGEDDYIWIAARDSDEAKTKSIQALKTSDVICEQDNDVLDTWFSSALYPFSSHGWPERDKNFDNLYPLSVMVTGHDILRFWVCRMVMLGSKLTDKLPFSKVLLHGIICDANGSKMSKSKGNVIDPHDVIEGVSLSDLNEKAKISHANKLLTDKELDVTLNNLKKQFPKGIPKCGTDALRFTLCSNDVKNTYIKFNIEDCLSNYHFCNKVWQCVRYANNLESKISKEILNSCDVSNLQSTDKWILSRSSVLVTTVTDALENFNFHIATNALRTFLYKETCDLYIEYTKLNSKLGDDVKIASHCHTFSAILNTSLRLLSPFMPQLSEELISHIPLKNNCIMNYSDSFNCLSYPNEKDFNMWRDEELENEFNVLASVVTMIRQSRAMFKIPKTISPQILVVCPDNHTADNVMKNKTMIKFLSTCGDITVDQNSTLKESKYWLYSNDKTLRIYLDMSEMESSKKSSEAENENLIRNVNKLRKNLEKLERTVSVEGFRKAPDHVQISHRNKIKALKEELKKIECSE